MKYADLDLYHFIVKNLIPVTLGNIVGGAVCIGPFQLTLGSIGLIITVFATIAIINAFNMIDGIDGLFTPKRGHATTCPP